MSRSLAFGLDLQLGRPFADILEVCRIAPVRRRQHVGIGGDIFEQGGCTRGQHGHRDGEDAGSPLLAVDVKQGDLRDGLALIIRLDPDAGRRLRGLSVLPTELVCST